MDPLDDLEDELERFWSPLSHLHAVVNQPLLRQCYEACLPKLSAYESSIGHHVKLYEAIKSIDKQDLNAIQAKILDDVLRDFVLSGVALSHQEQERFETISTRLSDLSNQFENNVLDTVNAFQLTIIDEKRLAGIPEHALDNARALAEEKGISGWILTLEFPVILL